MLLNSPASSRHLLFRDLRRCLRPISTASGAEPDHTRELLRRLLRETAQTVAVVTTVVPPPPSPSDPDEPPPTREAWCTHATSAQPVYHGATLSSFTSIALDPHPLVAFSLRVPSRMANALNAHAHAHTPRAPAPASANPVLPHRTARAHMVINLLSAAQPHLAVAFSRPDIYPHPFADPQLRWATSAEGVPVLAGALGALSCVLLRSVALWELGEDAGGMGATLDRPPDVQRTEGDGALASELFIARVLRVERVPELECGDASLRTLPLLYHRRRYATVSDMLPDSQHSL